MGFFDDDPIRQVHPENWADTFVDSLLPRFEQRKRPVTLSILIAQLREVPNRAIGAVAFELKKLADRKEDVLNETTIATLKDFAEIVVHHLNHEPNYPEPVTGARKTFRGKQQPPPFPDDPSFCDLINRGRQGIEEIRQSAIFEHIVRVAREIPNILRFHGRPLRSDSRWYDGVVRGGPFLPIDEIENLTAELTSTLRIENEYLVANYTAASNSVIGWHPDMSEAEEPFPSAAESGQINTIMTHAIKNDKGHISRSESIAEIGHRLTQAHPLEIFLIVSTRLNRQGLVGRRVQAHLRDLNQNWQDYLTAARLSPNDLQKALTNEDETLLPAEIRSRLLESRFYNPAQISQAIETVFRSVIFGENGYRLLLRSDGDLHAQKASEGLTAFVHTVDDSSQYALQSFNPDEFARIGAPTHTAGLGLDM